MIDLILHLFIQILQSAMFIDTYVCLCFFLIQLCTCLMVKLEVFETIRQCVCL